MIKKTIFKISGMHCTSCAFDIDGELEDTEGVKAASTNYARSQTEVSFDADTLTEEKIIDTIKRIGYEAHRADTN